MATISVVCAPSSTQLGPRRSLFLGPSRPLGPDAASLRAAPSGRIRHRSISAAVSRSSSGGSNPAPVGKKPGGSEKDPSNLWNRYVDWLYHHKDLGLSLDVSRIGFTEEFVQRVKPRLQKAIANPDERRMVRYYWLRSPELQKTLNDICKFADDILNKKKIKPPPSPTAKGFTTILYIGIESSALWLPFVAEALAPGVPPLKIRFIDNKDPAGIYHQIPHGEELASTLVIAISKHGETQDAQLEEVKKAFSDAKLEFSKQAVAITQENSSLDNRAREEAWLARFPMFDWVGGSMTSEISSVNLLPAALQGINIKEMIAGAALMDEAARTTKLKYNPAALLAMCWYWAFDGMRSKGMVVLPCKDSLLHFSWYLLQLVMKSLGNELDLYGNQVNQGSVAYGNKGSTDQHAYIQQLREGCRNFLVTFIEVLHDRPHSHDWEIEPGVTCDDYLFGMLQATRSALYANDCDSITVTVKEVTARSVGALIALHERAVGIYASLIDSIEAGKKPSEVLTLQKKVLDIVEASCKEPVRELTLEEIARLCDAPKQIELIYKIITHLAVNERLVLEGSWDLPQSIKVHASWCKLIDNKNG